MPDLSNINLWFGGLAILVAAIVSAVVSNRASKTAASKDALATLEASYTKLQATYLTENDRLNGRLDKLQNEKDALINSQDTLKNQLITDKVECQTQIANQQLQIIELRKQLTLVISQGADMVRKVVIVGTDIPVPVIGAEGNDPLPVKIVEPLPIPMTQALIDAAQKKLDKD